jgi:hypothetical protein
MAVADGLEASLYSTHSNIGTFQTFAPIFLNNDPAGSVLRVAEIALYSRRN